MEGEKHLRQKSDRRREPPAHHLIGETNGRESSTKIRMPPTMEAPPNFGGFVTAQLNSNGEVRSLTKLSTGSKKRGH